MNVTINENNFSKIAVIDSDEIIINNTQEALDLMATIDYIYGCHKMIVEKSAIIEEFFDLKTKLAGEILQKYTNYNMKIAIIGNFDNYKSKSLKDFIYESNKGTQVFFLPTKQVAIEKLHSVL